MFGEFAAVVGEDDGAGHGEDGLGKRECGTCDEAVTPGAGECKSEAGVGIGQGDEVTPESVAVTLNGTREGGGKVLGFTSLGGRPGTLGTPVVANPLGRMAHLIGCIRNEPTDGACARTI